MNKHWPRADVRRDGFQWSVTVRFGGHWELEDYKLPELYPSRDIAIGFAMPLIKQERHAASFNPGYTFPRDRSGNKFLIEF